MSNDLSFGPFRLDLDRHALLRDGSPIALGGRALDLLCALAAAGGQVVTKDALMEQVWPGLAVEENNIQVQISALRRMLREAGCKPDYIITVPGRGYRFAVANDQKPASQGNLPVSAAVVCNEEGDCWRIEGEPRYNPTLKLRLHKDDWRWDERETDRYRWRERGRGNGYYQGGVWIEIK